MATQNAATPTSTLPSGTPAVQQQVPRRIVVGERSEIPLSPMVFADSTLSSPLDLQKAGLLRRVRMLLTGNLTVALGAGAANWSAKGIWNLFGYPKLQTSANAPIVDASAYMQYIINKSRKFGFDPISVFNVNAGIATNIYNQPALAAGVYAVAAYLDQFVELDHSSFVGLLNLQEAGDAKVQLLMANWGKAGGSGLTAGGADSAVTFTVANAGNSATFAGQLAVQQLSYDIPLLDPKMGDTLPPSNVIHRYRTKRVTVNGTGDIPVNLDSGPVYTRVYLRLVLNGADDTNDVVKVRYVYGLNKTQIERPLAHQLAYQRDLFGQDFPTGIFIMDFGPNDVVRSASVAAPQIILNIANTAVLGNNNNFIEVVSEELIVLG